MSALCRDCLRAFDGVTPDRCPDCGGPRLLAHPELHELALAHIDCDAFYASIEKRDRPELHDKPVIIGGGRRGVVSTACYVARLYGVHSAMPMFKALKACPDATVLRPEMAKYAAIGREIRGMMREITPLVEPLSIDEAFLDLSGTEALHRGSPARTLSALALRIERELDLTVSMGLSYNKFLAKVASDLDKPRGFAVIGRAEAEDFLKDQPVALIWGVGKALQKALSRDGITRIGDLRAYDEAQLTLRYGAMGRRLHSLAYGKDKRRVDPGGAAKSISAETTFERDIDDLEALAGRLWPLCEKVAKRLKRAELAGRTATLKLKTADFRILTRSRKLAEPSQLAEVLYRAARPLLEREADGRRYRLIGIGASDLVEAEFADPPDLLDPSRARQASVERAIDAVRAKLGDAAIQKGRGMAVSGGERATGSGLSSRATGGPSRRPRTRRA